MVIKKYINIPIKVQPSESNTHKRIELEQDFVSAAIYLLEGYHRLFILQTVIVNGFLVPVFLI